MHKKLDLNCSILVERDYNAGVFVWIMDAPDPEKDWSVTRPRPELAGLILDAGYNSWDLAYWILERCLSKAAAEEWAGRFAVERINDETSLVWSIPVRGVRAWVDAHRQGELWDENSAPPAKPAAGESS